jgi:DNA-binding GntR family transcriptional regulator
MALSGKLTDLENLLQIIELLARQRRAGEWDRFLLLRAWFHRRLFQGA